MLAQRLLPRPQPMQNQSNSNVYEELYRASTLAWIIENKIKNEKGDPIEFSTHYFMLDFLLDNAQVKVLKKASQVGGTTLEVLDELHDMIFHGINQIHTLPTEGDVNDFVSSKVNPILRANGIKPDIDNTGIKSVGKGFLYYQGTFTERAPIIISSDRNIYDEVDRSKESVITDYDSRMGFSKIRKKVYLSTPTIANKYIDVWWGKSDQKHWRFDCPHCKHRQHMEWDVNVDQKRKIYVCAKCNKEVTHDDMRRGRWEARYPEREISGYWVNWMMAPWWTCADLIAKKDEMQDDQQFYNTGLGMAWTNPENRIPEGVVFKNLINIKNNERDCVMGVDVGEHDFHVILGNRQGVFAISRLVEANIDDTQERRKEIWRRLGEVMEVYDVRVCIIDARPLINEAMEFASKYPYKVFLHMHESRRKELEMATFGDETDFQAKPKDFEDEIKIISDINRVQDWVVTALRKGEIKFNFQSGDHRITALVHHFKAMYVQTATDKQENEYRQWASSYANHYWDAFCEWKLALYKLIKNGQ